MELSRAMVWFDSSDVYGHGAATRHPRAGSGTAQARTARNRAPSRCATPASPQLAWTLPPAVPSAVHRLHPLSRGRDKSNADSPALHPIPTGKSGSWHIFTLQRGWLEQEMGPVPIYTSTAPEPEPSFPSAVALYVPSHKRHFTKSPFLPYLHKSEAARA